MFTLIGIALVFAAVMGGYLLEKGNPYVLLQPAELLIVGGSACGIVLIANPPAVIRKIAKSTRGIFSPPLHCSRPTFLESLCLLYELFTYAQRAGMAALESEVEDPKGGRIFPNHSGILKDVLTLGFLCDSFRMLVIGVTTPNELDHLMDLDIETQRRGNHEPVSALSAIADALPGLGIVAAVLGVVITMQAIGASPETVGEKVAAALVGTFLGILLCYGVVGPTASRLESMSQAQMQYLQVLRTTIVAFAKGSSPILALEYGRRSIPIEYRPSFSEMETTIRRDAKIPPMPTDPAKEQNATLVSA